MGFELRFGFGQRARNSACGGAGEEGSVFGEDLFVQGVGGLVEIAGEFMDRWFGRVGCELRDSVLEFGKSFLQALVFLPHRVYRSSNRWAIQGAVYGVPAAAYQSVKDGVAFLIQVADKEATKLA